jgi:hypothetical protein
VGPARRAEVRDGVRRGCLFCAGFFRFVFGGQRPPFFLPRAAPHIQKKKQFMIYDPLSTTVSL